MGDSIFDLKNNNFAIKRNLYGFSKANRKIPTKSLSPSFQALSNFWKTLPLWTLNNRLFLTLTFWVSWYAVDAHSIFTKLISLVMRRYSDFRQKTKKKQIFHPKSSISKSFTVHQSEYRCNSDYKSHSTV